MKLGVTSALCPVRSRENQTFGARFPPQHHPAPCEGPCPALRRCFALLTAGLGSSSWSFLSGGASGCPPSCANHPQRGFSFTALQRARRTLPSMGCHSIFPPRRLGGGKERDKRECFNGSRAAICALCTCVVSRGWLWGAGQRGRRPCAPNPAAVNLLVSSGRRRVSPGVSGRG